MALLADCFLWIIWVYLVQTMTMWKGFAWTRLCFCYFGLDTAQANARLEGNVERRGTQERLCIVKGVLWHYESAL